MKITSLISQNSKQESEVVHKAFLDLSAADKVILIILSVIYKPIGTTKFDQVIRQLIDMDFLTQKGTYYKLTTDVKAKLGKAGMLQVTREGVMVNRLLANKLTEEVEYLEELREGVGHRKFISILFAAEHIVPVVNPYAWQDKRVDKQRLCRDFFYLNEIDNLEKTIESHKNPQIIDTEFNQILVELLFLPFSLKRFLILSDKIQYLAFATLFRMCQRDGSNILYPLRLLEQICKENQGNVLCRQLLCEQYLYTCRFEEYLAFSDELDSSSYGLQLQGAYQFLTSKTQIANTYYEKAIVAKNKISRRKKQYLGDLLGYFFKLSLIIEANQHDASLFNTLLTQCENEYVDQKTASDCVPLYLELKKITSRLSDGAEYLPHSDLYDINKDLNAFIFWLNRINQLIGSAWCNTNESDKVELSDNANVELAHQCVAFFSDTGYTLFANLSKQLADHFDTSLETNAANINKNNATKAPPLLINISSQIHRRAAWEHALDKLVALNPNSTNDDSEAKKAPQIEKTSRLIWELHLGRFKDELVPREQKRTKTAWSKGRVVSLKRLYENTDAFSFLLESDIKICRAIMPYQGYGYYAKTEYELEGLPALLAAVDAPNLYMANDISQCIDLIEKEPELVVSQHGSQLCLSMSDIEPVSTTDHLDERGYYTNDTNPLNKPYVLKQLNTEQYQLTVFSKEHLQVVDILGDDGLLVPISAKERVLEGIAAIAPFLNIQSDVAELDTGLDAVPCDDNLIINIQPIREGLEFTCVIMPFGEKGPAYKPGVGSANLSAEINGKRVATQRDLLKEQTLLDRLDATCPAFLSMPDNMLQLEDTQSALEALEQLENALSENKLPIILRWPKGKTVTLSKKLSSEQIQLGISKKTEWFDITGELAIDNNDVIELRKLLSLVSTSNGRFIKLDSERVLALSNDLRQKLEYLNQVTDEGKFHPVASLQVEEATSGMRMKTIHAWDKQTKQMYEANEIKPLVPSTLQAQLRDYQLEGFDWAMRLSHWGAGACLADDMGLGKTLQALGLLVARAQGGPSLVIAPTSVCFNWIQEAQRFAPTLNIKLFADAGTSAERAALLAELQAFDCVVLSYGLLQRESELLQKVQWHTLIADEAQALKNPLAKRTKAAYLLKADFNMVTTGTPIENDLTELWSLFRFINPGLLGNLKRFTQRFIQPIENAKEDKLAARKASQALKALIKPFILRRLKSQVLTELPARTEINVPIELSSKERAFYEALRLNAIDNISQASNITNAGEQRIKMLAELTKLRQACCHPKLVLEESELPSAKLEALNELLIDLRLNKHKALIFSQFVGHLQLIKQHLESKGISYQYLDGSTPQKARQQRVNAFQAGEGEVFLISLKAGGFGLNLTAADYVIHMDPWWNPAVEDQASDRSHRMGQNRPVTIYRMIAKNTIEEKIVSLHQHKRDLADKLLSGSDQATKLSVDDMLILLKDTF